MAERPLKPWEKAGSAPSAGSPFSPSSAAASTAEIVAAAGTQDDPSRPHVSAAVAGVGRNMPARPWEAGGGSAMSSYNRTGMGYGGMGSTLGSGYGSGYGSSGYGGGGMYGGGTTHGRSGYGGYGGGSGYGGSGYGGSSMYGGGMGAGRYGSSYGGGMGGYGGGYGGGMGSMGGYGGGMGMGMGAGMGGGAGMGMGGMGMGGMGGPMGEGDPNDPMGGMPPQPPSWWQSMQRVLCGMMNFFGRLAVLVNENTAAFHFFISALLELLDRSGSLYAEILRFFLRIFGIRPGLKTDKEGEAPRIEGAADMLPGVKGSSELSGQEGKGKKGFVPGFPPSGRPAARGPAAAGGNAPGQAWDTLWGPQ